MEIFASVAGKVREFYFVGSVGTLCICFWSFTWNECVLSWSVQTVIKLLVVTCYWCML